MKTKHLFSKLPIKLAPRYAVLFLLLFQGAWVVAQSTHHLQVGMRGNYSDFQDTKYSHVRNAGIGGGFDFGFQKQSTRNAWETGLNLNIGSENAATHSSGQALVVNPVIHFKYLRQVNENLALGGRVDLLDFYFRKTSGLGNNSVYYLMGSRLFASGRWQVPLAAGKEFYIGLDLGLLSLANEGTSFAFSAPQSALENGAFDYQDEALTNPFSYRYAVLRPLWRELNIRTAFDFVLDQRFTFGYHWMMRRFATLKGYPVTMGRHSLVVAYHFLRRPKQKQTVNK